MPACDLAKTVGVPSAARGTLVSGTFTVVKEDGMTSDPSVPDESGRPASYEEGLRQRALKSLKAKQEFKIHLTSYLVVNGFLVVLWAVTGRG